MTERKIKVEDFDKVLLNRANRFGVRAGDERFIGVCPEYNKDFDLVA